jgi:hypothetical protein
VWCSRGVAESSGEEAARAGWLRAQTRSVNTQLVIGCGSVGNWIQDNHARLSSRPRLPLGEFPRKRLSTKMITTLKISSRNARQTGVLSQLTSIFTVKTRDRRNDHSFSPVEGLVRNRWIHLADSSPSHKPSTASELLLWLHVR